jgi:hypothetical protein
MITELDGLPEGVIGFEASGKMLSSRPPNGTDGGVFRRPTSDFGAAPRGSGFRLRVG